jgi:hypothetical protein
MAKINHNQETAITKPPAKATATDMEDMREEAVVTRRPQRPRLKGDWRGKLAKALASEGRRRGVSPMKRVAQAFFDDESSMIAVLKTLVPQLKQIDAKIDQQDQFKLVIDLGGGDEDDAGETV